jgi:phage gpG-like protein
MSNFDKSRMASRRAPDVHVGETNVNTAGRLMTIVRYNNSKNVAVEFEDGTLVVTQYANFQRGAVKYPGDAVHRPRLEAAKLNRVGETHMLSNGMLATIIAYRNNTDIDVMFEDGAIVHHVAYHRFLTGAVRHPDSISHAIPKRPTISVAERFPELIHEWDFGKNAELTPTNTPASTTHKIWWKCGAGHNWQSTPMMHARRECPFCAAKKFAIEYDGHYNTTKETGDD